MRVLQQDLKVCWPEADWNALHLRLIYFGREHCAAQRHDPMACLICKWAAVEPYNRQVVHPFGLVDNEAFESH
jgi:endonuclease III